MSAPAPNGGISRLPDFAVKPLDKRPGELPPLKLDHLRHMTDETGMLQHALFTVPNYREGYTTDDNARALMVSALLEELGNEEALELASRYLAFIWYAFNAETGRFRNFMDYQRHWLEDERFGRQPRPRAVGAGHRVGPLEHAGPSEHGGPAVRAGVAGDSRNDQPAGLGVRAHRHSRVSAALCRRPQGQSGARRIGRAAARVVSKQSLRKSGAGLRESELLQRRAAARYADVRSIDPEYRP